MTKIMPKTGLSHESSRFRENLQIDKAWLFQDYSIGMGGMTMLPFFLFVI